MAAQSATQVADALAEKLVTEIRDLGLRAERRTGLRPGVATGLMISGQFVGIDQGNEPSVSPSGSAPAAATCRCALAGHFVTVTLVSGTLQLADESGHLGRGRCRSRVEGHQAAGGILRPAGLDAVSRALPCRIRHRSMVTVAGKRRAWP